LKGERYRNKAILIAVAVLVLYLAFTLSPILWTLGTSFKNTDEVYRVPPLWLPKPSLKYYVMVFTTRPFLEYTLNSLAVALGVTAVCVTIGALAAHGFGKYQSPLIRSFFNLIIGSRMIPPVCMITPFAIIFSATQLTDTRLGLIIACTSFNLPFAIWIMKNYFESVPRELEDSARIDGCDNIGTFWHVSLPIARPGIVTAGIIAFLFTWNEFVFAALLTRTTASKTLPIGITDFFMDDYIQWNLLAAATIFLIIPAIIFVSFFQRQIMKGMIAGSLKG
jgi:multiple sugar transport system permease protein